MCGQLGRTTPHTTSPAGLIKKPEQEEEERAPGVAALENQHLAGTEAGETPGTWKGEAAKSSPQCLRTEQRLSAQGPVPASYSPLLLIKKLKCKLDSPQAQSQLVTGLDHSPANGSRLLQLLTKPMILSETRGQGLERWHRQTFQPQDGGIRATCWLWGQRK